MEDEANRYMSEQGKLLGCSREKRSEINRLLKTKRLLVLERLANGEKVEAIGKGLGISVRMVYHYINELRDVFEARSTRELIYKATRWGFI